MLEPPHLMGRMKPQPGAVMRELLWGQSGTKSSDYRRSLRTRSQERRHGANQGR